MARMIDADALKYDLDEKVRFKDTEDYWKVMDVIDSAPTIEERKKGRWIRHESPNLGKCMKVLYECSVCKAWLGCEYFLRRSFCPNCGAEMEGAEK